MFQCNFPNSKFIVVFVCSGTMYPRSRVGPLVMIENSKLNTFTNFLLYWFSKAPDILSASSLSMCKMSPGVGFSSKQVGCSSGSLGSSSSSVASSCSTGRVV